MHEKKCKKQGIKSLCDNKLADVVEALYDKGDRDKGVKIIESIFLKGRNVGLNKFRYRFEFWYQRFVPYKGDDAS